jgi:cytidine deaminase
MQATTTATINELSEADRALYDAAVSVSRNAYAPYSGFCVGACLRTEAGGVYTGCNVENASFGLTVCAERNAVFAAVAAEGPTMRVREIAIFATAHTPSPCGACRQVLAEFGYEARVLFPTGERVLITTVNDLLPVAFELRTPTGV